MYRTTITSCQRIIVGISSRGLVPYTNNSSSNSNISRCSYCSDKKPKTNNKIRSPRMEEFQKKLREKTPIGKLDEMMGPHPYAEKQPLEAWPNNTNPHTGEVNGPRGPEPTRYGDWERKGRVSDF